MYIRKKTEKDKSEMTKDPKIWKSWRVELIYTCCTDIHYYKPLSWWITISSILHSDQISSLMTPTDSYFSWGLVFTQHSKPIMHKTPPPPPQRVLFLSISSSKLSLVHFTTSGPYSRLTFRTLAISRTCLWRIRKSLQTATHVKILWRAKNDSCLTSTC